jgi:hypothetical protein
MGLLLSNLLYRLDGIVPNGKEYYQILFGDANELGSIPVRDPSGLWMCPRKDTGKKCLNS